MNIDVIVNVVYRKTHDRLSTDARSVAVAAAHWQLKNSRARAGLAAACLHALTVLRLRLPASTARRGAHFPARCGYQR